MKPLQNLQHLARGGLLHVYYAAVRVASYGQPAENYFPSTCEIGTVTGDSRQRLPKNDDDASSRL